MSDLRPLLKLVYMDGRQELVSCERCQHFEPVGGHDALDLDGRCGMGIGGLVGKGFGCADFVLDRRRAAIRAVMGEDCGGVPLLGL